MSCFTKYKSQLQESTWLLGICENGYEDLKAGRIHWIDNGEYKGKKWFADPFILNYDNKRITLLVEEFDYKVHRGRIARLHVDRKTWKLIDCKIVLDLDTHLSFPMIWREDNNVYVFPENYHSGGWSMYRYDEKEERLVYIQQVSNEKLTDAIIWKNGGDYYLLSTHEPKPNGPELTIWKSKCLQDGYTELQRMKFNENLGRNAGMIFRHGEKWIRPAQESNHVYGHSISFQEVNLQKDGLSFNEIFRFYSPHNVYYAGTHTYNTLGKMAVIDVKGWKHPHIGPLLKGIGNILIKLGLKKAYIPQ